MENLSFFQEKFFTLAYLSTFAGQIRVKTADSTKFLRNLSEGQKLASIHLKLKKNSAEMIPEVTCKTLQNLQELQNS